MKYLKTFETLVKNPIFLKYADSVLIDFEHYMEFSPALKKFVENNVGRVIDTNEGGAVTLYYENIPDDDYFKGDSDNKPFKNNMICLHKDWIKYSSNKKEDIEMLINSKKYNL